VAVNKSAIALGEPMKNDEEEWNICLSDRHRVELDEDLIAILNEKYSDHHDEKLPGAEPGHKSKALRFISLVTVIVFIVFALHNLFTLLSLPSLTFLNRSWELGREPHIQQMQEAVVVISTADSRGTGFNIAENGLIITSNHVVKGAKNIEVNFFSGEMYKGTIRASFPEFDLAVIDIPGRNLPTVAIESEHELAEGDEILVIGNPLQFSQIVTEGEVVGEILLKGWDVPVFMIKAPIYRGSSGSPVINHAGRVVAVIFATLVSEVHKEKIGLAVPIRWILEE
jgi:S1-C subfamily serine protease